MMTRLALALTAVILATMLFAGENGASAADITFIKEYTYQASDIDSKVSSRTIALEQVKRALLEELGTYLISETEVRSYQLTKDQVTTLTAGIVGAEIVEEKWDGWRYYLKARITADPGEVAKSVEALRNDHQRSLELEESRKRTDAALREVARLRRELESARPPSQVNYSKKVDELSEENDRLNAEREKYRVAIKDIPPAHLQEVWRTLGYTGTAEDFVREEAERQNRGWFENFLMDLFGISR